jgi:Fe-S-cluster-containing hydrogenase component 2
MYQSDIQDDMVFQRLAKHLDDLPAGFPATKDDLDMRLLKRLFTPEEAELAIHLTLIPETANVIAFRAKQDVEDVSNQLESMAGKGLIYSIKKKDKPVLYMANQIVIGIWEYHVNNLDKGLIEDMNKYIPFLLEESWKIPQLRTIPVNKSIQVKTDVMIYEDAEQLMKRSNKIVLAPCICRKEKTMMGEGCDKPEESCIIFGNAADYYLRNGMGREISYEEGLEVLKRADETGLVLQPGNSKKANNICCCCGCCCGVLRTLKHNPKPAEMVSSAFYAVSNPELCDVCGICEDRCQMDAISYDAGYSEIILDRCIGCGLCVTTCPTDALSMVRKPNSAQVEVPESSRELYIQLGRARGKLSWFKIAGLLAKSKIDRWRAA